jgi:hypothetical protein
MQIVAIQSGSKKPTNLKETLILLLKMNANIINLIINSSNFINLNREN